MIVSSKNRWVKDIRRSRRSKGADTLLEGPHLVATAIEVGLPLRAVLATPELLDRDDLRPLLEKLPMPPLEIDGSLLASVLDSDSPRGIVALADRQAAKVTDLSLANGVYVFADGLQDPGNFGALARSAEAAGAIALISGPGCCHDGHPRALRSSAGSLLRRPALVATADSLNDALTAHDPTWLLLETRGGQSIYQPLPSGPVILAVGSEGQGLSRDTLAVAQPALAITIPMAGDTESLNATIAAAITLFELQRQRLG